MAEGGYDRIPEWDDENGDYYGGRAFSQKK